MPLFEVAVVSTRGDELLFGPKAVAAADEQTAAVKAVAGSDKPVDMTEAKVLVRPFK